MINPGFLSNLQFSVFPLVICSVGRESKVLEETDLPLKAAVYCSVFIHPFITRFEC